MTPERLKELTQRHAEGEFGCTDDECDGCDTTVVIEELLDEVAKLHTLVAEVVEAEFGDDLGGKSTRSVLEGHGYGPKEEAVSPRSRCCCNECQVWHLKPVVKVLCCIDCSEPLGSVFYGAGDGTGQKFRCEKCHKAYEDHKEARRHAEAAREADLDSAFPFNPEEPGPED